MTLFCPVDAGTYDLEVRVAGTDTVALTVPDVMLEDGTVYTVFAMGFAGGQEPALTAVLSADAMHAPQMLPETGGAETPWALLIGMAGLLVLGFGGAVRFASSRTIA